MSEAACAKEIICRDKAQGELQALSDTLQQMSTLIGNFDFSIDCAEVVIDMCAKARTIIMEKAAQLQG